MPLTSDFFHLERDGAIVHLTMNRPDKANGMNADFWNDLPRLLSEVGDDETVRVGVISGEGKHFTSGMDLEVFSQIAALFDKEPGRASHAMRELILKLQDTFNAIERARFPVIAAIHGACLGAGVDMITACDIRLASADAFFSIEEVNVGMAADVGTLQRLPKLIAPAVAAELALTGRRFAAVEAKEFGLVSKVAQDRESLLKIAFEIGRIIAEKSPLAIAGIKRNLAYARDHTVADGLDYIATWNGGMLRSHDLMAAVTAKQQKTKAEFADLVPVAGLS